MDSKETSTIQGDEMVSWWRARWWRNVLVARLPGILFLPPILHADFVTTDVTA